MSSGNTVYHSDWNKNDYIRLQRQHYQMDSSRLQRFIWFHRVWNRLYLFGFSPIFSGCLYIVYNCPRSEKKLKKIKIFLKKGLTKSNNHDIIQSQNQLRSDNIKNLIIRLDDDLHQKLKLISVYNSEPIQKIVEQLIKDYVNQKQLPNNKK